MFLLGLQITSVVMVQYYIDFFSMFSDATKSVMIHGLIQKLQYETISS